MSVCVRGDMSVCEVCVCSEELWRCLEEMRGLILNRAAVRIQAAVRRFLCRAHWPQLKVSLRQARLQGEAQSKLRYTHTFIHSHTPSQSTSPTHTPPHSSTSSTVPPPQATNGERVYTVRNYTIVGNYKVGFPQWRVMKCSYPESTLTPGGRDLCTRVAHRREAILL